MSVGPRKTPMRKAAKSPIGQPPVAASAKWRDFSIVVLAPVVVPGLLLGVGRAHGGSHVAFTLGDVAFGFVAVAFAGIARAVVSKAEAWEVFTVLAAVTIAAQVGVASFVDSVDATNGLVNLITLSNDLETVNGRTAIVASANNVVALEPSIWQWSWCLIFGAFLITLTSIYIKGGK
ncbi:hypothetical protein [Flexivirga oryzae]|uniref:Uncharacterized protein n=1 Tax=Flexivirga oryzae TaxID=1794944 RepID=A0A839NBB6_9MICO|nr:hypothetical protein [Flexivirga oryzae]MBB2891892.1 hypothetical protein [Flexivirga oryzae]